VLLMCLNVFVLLMAYYIRKTVREPLILLRRCRAEVLRRGGPGADAHRLRAPLRLGLQKLPRQQFLAAVILSSSAASSSCYLGHRLGCRTSGSSSSSGSGSSASPRSPSSGRYANEIYTRPEGDRRLPLVAIGSTAGAPLGAAAAADVRPRAQPVPDDGDRRPSSALLCTSCCTGGRRARGGEGRPPAAEPIRPANGFALVFKSPYLRLVALLLVILNIVNTVGEYILGQAVVAHADASRPSAPPSTGGLLGLAYGTTSFPEPAGDRAPGVRRLEAREALRHQGGLYALPIVALRAYGTAAAGAPSAFCST